MRFLKKFLILIFVVCIGIVWGIREVGNIKNTKKDTDDSKLISPPQEFLKFAVMSDIHLDKENFIKALRKAKADGMEFVVITGDLTSLGKKDELISMKAVLDQETLPYYVIPGNHDLWFSEKVKINFFKEVFGREYQSFKIDEIKFILINNGSYLGLSGVPGVGDKNQKDWLKEEVKECPQITCLVFMHMPLNHPTSLHVMGEDNESVKTEAKELIKLFTENKVKETFAGHLHFSSSYELEGLKTTIAGAITSDRNVQSPKFLELILRGDESQKKEIFID